MVGHAKPAADTKSKASACFMKRRETKSKSIEPSDSIQTPRVQWVGHAKAGNGHEIESKCSLYETKGNKIEGDRNRNEPPAMISFRRPAGTRQPFFQTEDPFVRGQTDRNLLLLRAESISVPTTHQNKCTAMYDPERRGTRKTKRA